jgi:hypothetical protein
MNDATAIFLSHLMQAYNLMLYSRRICGSFRCGLMSELQRGHTSPSFTSSVLLRELRRTRLPTHRMVVALMMQVPPQLHRAALSARQCSTLVR